MKKVLVILILIILSFGFFLPVKADMGPKPTTTVEVIGLNQAYTFDILYQVSKAEILTEEDFQRQISHHYNDSYPETLNGFFDEEGFASYTLYRSFPHHIIKEDDHLFRVGYFMPPTVFKIALILESGEVIMSQVLTKKLFDAKFVFDLSNFSFEDETIINSVKVYQANHKATKEIIPWQTSIGKFFLTVSLTLLIELFILFLFNYRQKSSYLLALVVNIISQVLLYLALIISNLYYSFFGFIGALIVGELIVLLFEGIIYWQRLKEHQKSRAIIYTVLANLISVILGVILYGL